MSSHITREFILNHTPQELRCYVSRILPFEKYQHAIAPLHNIEKKLLISCVDEGIPVRWLLALYIASMKDSFALVWPTNLYIAEDFKYKPSENTPRDSKFFKYICVVPKQHFHNIASAIIRTCIELNSTVPLVKFLSEWKANGTSSNNVMSSYSVFEYGYDINPRYLSCAADVPIIIPARTIFNTTHFVLDCAGGGFDNDGRPVAIAYTKGSQPYECERKKPINVFTIRKIDGTNIKINVHGALWPNVRCFLFVMRGGTIRGFWPSLPKDVLVIIIEWYMCAMSALD